MPEILTESFCERCGTRYTFESGARTPRPLTGIKVLTQGLKNFVMSDDTSMDEAMAAARSDAERKATTQQLDAFHKTFNFCMTCRQYTCANCWNEAEAKCLTCAPHLGREIMPAPFPTLDTSTGIAPLEAGVGGHVHEGSTSFESAPTAWPTLDGMPSAEPAQEGVQEPIEEIDLGARLRELALDGDGAGTTDGSTAVSSDEPVAEELTETPVEAAADADVPVQWPEVVEPQLAAEEPDAAEPVAAEPAAAETVAEPAIPADEAVDSDDPMAAARQQTASLLARFRPGQSLDDALDEFERGEAAAEADRDVASPPEVVPTEAEAEARSEPEPVAVEPEHAAEPEPEPVAAAEPEPAPSGRPTEDQIEQPTWPVSAPQPAADVPRPDRREEQPALPAAARATPPAEPPAAPQWPAQPQWPSQPQWPAAGTAAPDATILGRPVVPTGGIDALWAASSGEVLGQPLTGPEPARPQPAPVGVRPCVSCGLSLSSTARFCRRCGTPQGPA